MSEKNKIIEQIQNAMLNASANLTVRDISSLVQALEQVKEEAEEKPKKEK